MLFTIITAVVGLLGAVIALVIVAKQEKEKHGIQRWGPIVVALCPILAILVQPIQQWRSDVDHSKELSDANDKANIRYEMIKHQNDSLHNQIDGVTKELSDAHTKIKEMTNPTLVFVEDETTATKDDKTSQHVTTYHWTSKPVAAVRNAAVHVRFDCGIIHAQSLLTPRLPQSNLEKLTLDPDGKGVRFRATILPAGTDIRIRVWTETPPKILSSESSP